MKKNILLSGILSLFISCKLPAQKPADQLAFRIDSLLAAPAERPFNGIVLVTGNGKVIYEKVQGYADVEHKKPLQAGSRFLVGSISKQFTGVLVLREMEKGHIDLQAKIRRYLPELKQAWADSVTVHQLLTHTHGIPEDLAEKLEFSPGSAYRYSQAGYALLARITEKTSGLSFEEQARRLFRECGMKNSFPPDARSKQTMVKAYTCNADGTWRYIAESPGSVPTAAGGFISTAGDLAIWNKALHGGKLLQPETYKQMMSAYPNAVRDHPLFGKTKYGYGTTVDNKEGLLQYGQTGYVPGSASMDFYFPQTKTGIIILNNVVRYPEDLNAAFSYHMALWNIVRAYCRD